MDELVDLSRPLLAALPAWALKGVALLLAAGLADLLLRRRPAALRHLVWGGTLAGLLAMPLLPGLLPPLEMTVELPPALARAQAWAYPDAQIAEGSVSAPTGFAARSAEEPLAAPAVVAHEAVPSPSWTPARRED